jgi:hypothetical protein
VGEQPKLPAFFFFSFLLGFRIYLFAERNVTLVNALLSHVPAVKSEEGRRDRREEGRWGKGKLYSGGSE